MFPIGSTVIAPLPAPAAASRSFVLQASLARPLTRTPQEPQIAAWHEHLMPIDPSSRSFACRMPSRTL
jgi:hypothetical protein